ncbi:MAG: CoA transferase [Gammaproteobacteria bacterium]|nr:CoA transferase [Gammaproteobacteria bacterium]
MHTEHLLTGIRILDLTRVLAGPTCTRLFAEMGADVFKIEAAPNGEMARAIGRLRNDRSLHLIQQNLNKRSLCIDLRKPEGIDLIRQLVPHCDVVVENFRPGTMDSIGLGYAALQALRPDIIMCSISALGQSGPLSSKPGYDPIAQAYSGVSSMIGEPDEVPCLPSLGLGDVSTGVHAAFAIAAALLHRARTGRGQALDIALLDCYYHYHEASVYQASASDGQLDPTRGGRHYTYVCPTGIFPVKDRALALVAFLHHWPDLCAAMSRPDMVTDPRYATDAARVKRRAEVVGIIEAWLDKFPDVASAITHLEAHNLPCAPVLSVKETLTHPHFLARGTVRTVTDPIAGAFQIPGMPIKTSDYSANLPYVAPRLGEHNAEILTELLGMGPSEVDALMTAGVLMSGPN